MTPNDCEGGADALAEVGGAIAIEANDNTTTVPMANRRRGDEWRTITVSQFEREAVIT
jgi:hypothetical protein